MFLVQVGSGRRCGQIQSDRLWQVIVGRSTRGSQLEHAKTDQRRTRTIFHIFNPSQPFASTIDNTESANLYEEIVFILLCCCCCLCLVSFLLSIPGGTFHHDHDGGNNPA